MGFRGALPRRPHGWLHLSFSWDDSPSGPKIQACSAVSVEKKLLITPDSPNHYRMDIGRKSLPHDLLRWTPKIGPAVKR